MSERVEKMSVDRGAYGGKSSIDMHFPSNSHKKTATEKPKVEKVIGGTVIQKKKSMGQKMASTFLGDQTKNVGGYFNDIFYDVLIPAAKSMICDTVGWGGFAEMILFGDTKGRGRTRRDRDRTYVSYDRPSYAQKDNSRLDNRSRAAHNFDNIILENRGEAEEVLSHMVDLVTDYGIVSVGDLYSLVGIESNHTDEKWGWTNLRDASVDRVRDGYRINLPRATQID